MFSLKQMKYRVKSICSSAWGIMERWYSPSISSLWKFLFFGETWLLQNLSPQAVPREDYRQLCAKASEHVGARKSPMLSLVTVKSGYSPLEPPLFVWGQVAEPLPHQWTVRVSVLKHF